MESLQSPRGFHDIFGEKNERIKKISLALRTKLIERNFQEIILPIVEYAELFQRGVGQLTDIVQKEMFTFSDSKQRLLALRPEGTASAVRAYLQHKLYTKPWVKLFYEGPMFRHERPQLGRYRQFHQLGAEVFGISEPYIDAQLIEILWLLAKELNLEFRLEINSVGCKVCRPDYKLALIEYLHSVKDSLCQDCLKRMDKNPLRVLDCKVQTCQEATKEAPFAINYLCSDCKTHQDGLESALDSLGIDYVINPRLVRGLDYYTRSVFEFVSLKSSLTLMAGGRYDYLVEELGGPKTPAVGFAVGLERLAEELSFEVKEDELILVIAFGDVLDYALKVYKHLCAPNRRVDLIFKPPKKGLEIANKVGARFVALVGQEEKSGSFFTLKDLQTGFQERIELYSLKETKTE
ncbi:MAG: histidine--tRNA ligase [Aquificaceae bacterium]|nr:histidine--tRNA ligase [Aquificaceae bacterium]MDW8237121.1 histidine--tRNA ligase [Aquificaceae bacterium]